MSSSEMMTILTISRIQMIANWQLFTEIIVFLILNNKRPRSKKKKKNLRNGNILFAIQILYHILYQILYHTLLSLDKNSDFGKPKKSGHVSCLYFKASRGKV